MRKIIISAVCLLASAMSFAQTKGDHYLAVTPGASHFSSSLEGYSSWSVSLMPEYGVFVTDRLSLGAFINPQFTRTTVLMSDTCAEIRYAFDMDLGAVARYHLPLAKKITYSPSLYLGTSPSLFKWPSSHRESSSAFSLWSSLMLTSIDINVNDRFRVNVNTLTLSTQCARNAGALNIDCTLRLSPLLSFRYNF